MLPLLALLGAGLGLFVPANNTAIMAAIPTRMSATAGGMVNMTRGAGTALGIALVTLTLHTAATVQDGARLAFAGLAVVAAVATMTGITARRQNATDTS
jgi:MFS family permease